MKKLIPLAFAAAIALAGCTEGNHPPSSFGGEAAQKQGGGGAGPTIIYDQPAPKLGDLGEQRNTAANTVFFNEATGEYDPAAIVATIYFEFDRYVASKAELGKLNALGATGTNLIAAGYTDYYGTDQYNQALSDRRAHSTKNYLTGIGYQDAKIEVQAFGKRYAKQGGGKAEVAKDRKVVIVNRDHKSAAVADTVSAAPPQ